jgi:hypothetical protein
MSLRGAALPRSRLALAVRRWLARRRLVIPLGVVALGTPVAGCSSNDSNEREAPRPCAAPADWKSGIGEKGTVGEMRRAQLSDIKCQLDSCPVLLPQATGTRAPLRLEIASPECNVRGHLIEVSSDDTSIAAVQVSAESLPGTFDVSVSAVSEGRTVFRLTRDDGLSLDTFEYTVGRPDEAAVIDPLGPRLSVIDLPLGTWRTVVVTSFAHKNRLGGALDDAKWAAAGSCRIRDADPNGEIVGSAIEVSIAEPGSCGVSVAWESLFASLTIQSSP